MNTSVERWYRQVHPTSWVAYIGRRMVGEGIDRAGLMKNLEDRGFDPSSFAWIPLRVHKFV